jgi:hypothetical protein
MIARTRKKRDNWCQCIFLSDNDTDTNSDQHRDVAVDARDEPRKQREKKRPVSLAAWQVSHRPGRPLALSLRAGGVNRE